MTSRRVCFLAEVPNRHRWFFLHRVFGLPALQLRYPCPLICGASDATWLVPVTLGIASQCLLAKSLTSGIFFGVEKVQRQKVSWAACGRDAWSAAKIYIYIYICYCELHAVQQGFHEPMVSHVAISALYIPQIPQGWVLSTNLAAP